MFYIITCLSQLLVLILLNKRIFLGQNMNLVQKPNLHVSLFNQIAALQQYFSITSNGSISLFTDGTLS